jgi:PAS domain S-box-containing protein
VLRVDALSEVESTLTRYDLVLRATRDAVWEWNVTTQEAWWNGRQYEMLGYDPKTTRPSYEAWVSRVHPEDRARVVANFDAAVAGGATIWQDEFRFLRGDGSVGTTLDRGYIGRDQQGRPMRMIGVMSDVTEERAAAIALAGSEERFRQLASAIDEVFWMINAAGNEMIYVSPAYESIWGRTCQSLYEAPESFLDPIHEDDRPRIEARLPAQRAGGYHEVYRIRRPNGELAWIRAAPVPDRRAGIWCASRRRHRYHRAAQPRNASQAPSSRHPGAGGRRRPDFATCSRSLSSVVPVRAAGGFAGDRGGQDAAGRAASPRSFGLRAARWSRPACWI